MIKLPCPSRLANVLERLALIRSASLFRTSGLLVCCVSTSIGVNIAVVRALLTLYGIARPSDLKDGIVNLRGCHDEMMLTEFPRGCRCYKEGTYCTERP